MDITGKLFFLVLTLIFYSYRDCDATVRVATPVYQWTSVDFDWPTSRSRDTALLEKTFVPLYNSINGIRTYKGQIYVTVPRLGSGIPSTLNVIVTKKGSDGTNKHVLKPYPSWQMQMLGDCKALQFVQNIEIDPSTGYMYIVDTGHYFRGGPCPAKVVIYDIVGGYEVHRYNFPNHVAGIGTNYLNDVVIDYVDGKAHYLYITDTLGYKLVVYDIKADKSYAFQDYESMKPDSDYINVTISNEVVQVSTGINGIGISPDFSYVYYSPIAGLGIYQVPTAVLRNSSSTISKHVRKVGSKPSQGDGMLMGRNHNLYFSILSENSVAMWNISDAIVKHGSEGNISMDNYTTITKDTRMQWVDSFALDAVGNLWFTSSKLQSYFNDNLNQHTSNYYIWKIFVNETSYAHFNISHRPETDVATVSLDRPIDTVTTIIGAVGHVDGRHRGVHVNHEVTTESSANDSNRIAINSLLFLSQFLLVLISVLDYF